jgi:hypothetical protein
MKLIERELLDRRQWRADEATEIQPDAASGRGKARNYPEQCRAFSGKFLSTNLTDC